MQIHILCVHLLPSQYMPSVVCNPTRESYDVDYQWQNSTDGLNWNDIPNAVNSTYSVCDDDFLKYLRVVVSAEENGNTLYPKTVISSSTNCKAVILGDVSLDATVSISDATLIQLYCADMQTFSNEQALAADVNRDGNININGNYSEPPSNSQKPILLHKLTNNILHSISFDC